MRGQVRCVGQLYQSSPKKQKRRMGEPNTNCDKFLMMRYLPVSEDNVFGVIPLLGLTSSFFTAGLFVQLMTSNVRYLEWSVGWICMGLLVFALVECFWGFHANHTEMLQLWLNSKWVELGLNITGIAFGVICGDRNVEWLVFSGVCNIVIISILLNTGCVKRRYWKKIAEKNASVDEQTLPDKINVV